MFNLEVLRLCLVGSGHPPQAAHPLPYMVFVVTQKQALTTPEGGQCMPYLEQEPPG